MIFRCRFTSEFGRICYAVAFGVMLACSIAASESDEEHIFVFPLEDLILKSDVIALGSVKELYHTGEIRTFKKDVSVWEVQINSKDVKISLIPGTRVEVIHGVLDILRTVKGKRHLVDGSGVLDSLAYVKEYDVVHGPEIINFSPRFAEKETALMFLRKSMEGTFQATTYPNEIYSIFYPGESERALLFFKNWTGSAVKFAGLYPTPQQSSRIRARAVTYVVLSELIGKQKNFSAPEVEKFIGFCREVLEHKSGNSKYEMQIDEFVEGLQRHLVHQKTSMKTGKE